MSEPSDAPLLSQQLSQEAPWHGDPTPALADPRCNEEAPDSDVDMEEDYDEIIAPLRPKENISSSNTGTSVPEMTPGKKRDASHWPTENRAEVVILTPRKRQKTC